ncbi:MAG: hypothetical protein JWQ02_2950 [Capsulimonas sp.]|jgi:hypothetical protein|nr:hypothetical protein [Capsulimonas sp.]
MIIDEVAPMLTCIQSNDGFLYELLMRAHPDQPAVTKIRIGPYLFKPEHQPKVGPLGVMTQGPEPKFWIMHRMTDFSNPRGWQRLHWEIADNEPGSPAYLVARGLLKPGTSGLFRFLSTIPPGGVRAGMEIYRGDDHKDYGVSGPNYEPYMQGHDEH